MTPSTTAKARTDSTDRTPALAASRTGSVRLPKSSVARVGSAARRLLNSLMRSLATPHI
jgi:hypothetical protein